MPQLMPLMWLLSSFMVIVIFMTMVMVFGEKMGWGQGSNGQDMVEKVKWFW